MKTPFRKEVIAVKPEHAVEKVYTELGSRHRVKRFHIKISKVEEVAPQDIEDPLIRKMMIGEEKIGEQI
ncbi:MAG: 50S ribosomal protein L18Ae [Candidatus Bathycorpusculaceae bacterium]